MQPMLNASCLLGTGIKVSPVPSKYLDSCAEIKSSVPSVAVTDSGRVWRKVPESHGFVGISQADTAGLEKDPRWAKICSKSFQTKTRLDFVILSLSLCARARARARACVYVCVCVCVCVCVSMGKRGSECGLLSRTLPAQVTWQCDHCTACPLQYRPPSAGAGLLHIRKRLRLPEPHVTEHAVHTVHGLQSPSWGNTSRTEKRHHVAFAVCNVE